MHSTIRSKRSAFTLVELVVVVVIIAILAAVATPKFFDKAGKARESAALQSLSTLRSAIELYKAENSKYPTDLTTDLKPFLKGAFPTVNVGNTNSAAVKTTTDGHTMVVSEATKDQGWLYDSNSGELRISEATLFNY